MPTSSINKRCEEFCAGRATERGVFTAFTAPAQERRLLAVWHGDPKRLGKSALLREFKRLCSEDRKAPAALLDLSDAKFNSDAGARPGIEVPALEALAEHLKGLWEAPSAQVSFPRFEETKKKYVKSQMIDRLSLNVEKIEVSVPITGSIVRNSQIGNVSLNALDYVALAEECAAEFIQDLAARGGTGENPALLIFDGWSESDPNLREWLWRTVISPLCFEASFADAHVRAVIAGRTRIEAPTAAAKRPFELRVMRIDSLSEWDDTSAKEFFKANSVKAPPGDLLRFYIHMMNTGWDLHETIDLALHFGDRPPRDFAAEPADPESPTPIVPVDPALVQVKRVVADLEANEPAWLEVAEHFAFPRRLDPDFRAVLESALREDADDASRSKDGAKATRRSPIPFDDALKGLSDRGVIAVDLEGRRAVHPLLRSTLLSRLRDVDAKRWNVMHDRLSKAFLIAAKKRLDEERDAPGSDRSAGRSTPNSPLSSVALCTEALYHRACLDEDAAFKALEDWYSDTLEPRALYTSGEELIAGLRQILLDRGASGAAARVTPWLEYYRARIANLRGRSAEAEHILLPLLDLKSDDSKLRLWVMGELGISLHQQSRLPEAAEKFSWVVKERELSRADTWNLSFSYGRLADVHSAMGNTDDARRCYRLAILHESEQSLRRVPYQLSLSMLLDECGRGPEAVRLALDALRNLRMASAHHASLRAQTARHFATLLSRRSLRDALAAHHECTVASGPATDDGARANIAQSLLGIYRDSGCWKAAERMLAERTGGVDDRHPAIRFAYCQIIDDRGDATRAIAAYEQFIAENQNMPSERWTVAAARSNRGIGLVSLGRYDEARTALTDVLKEWKTIGNEAVEGVVRVALAKIPWKQALVRAVPDGPLRPAIAAWEKGDWPQALAEVEKAITAARESNSRLAGLGAAFATYIEVLRANWSTAASLAENGAKLIGGLGRAPEQPLCVIEPQPDLIAETQTQLDEIATMLSPASLKYFAAHQQLQGSLLWSSGRFDAARGNLESAVSIAESLNNRSDLSQYLAELAIVNILDGHPEIAAANLYGARAALQSLAATERVSLDPSTDDIDKRAAEHVNAAATDAGAPQSAIEFLSSIPTAKRAVWHTLNHALLAAHSGQWENARAALEELDRLSPAWLEQSVLRSWMMWTLIRQGERDADNAKTAASSYSAALHLARLIGWRTTFEPQEQTSLFQALADGLRACGDSDGSREVIAVIRADALATGDYAALGEAMVRTFAAQDHTSDVQMSLSWLRQSISAFRQSGVADPAQRILASLKNLVRTRDELRHALTCLRVIAEDPGRAVEERTALIRARGALARAQYSSCTGAIGVPSKGSNGNAPSRAIILPIAVECEPLVYPQEENWDRDHPLLHRYPVDARARVRDRFGMMIPGIRFRVNHALKPGQYVVLVSEIFAAQGRVEIGRCFIPTDPTAPAFDRQTGECTGRWVDARDSRSSDGAAWDHFEYIVRHCEAVCARHLDTFMGHRELGDYLKAWVKGEPNTGESARRQRVIDRTLPTPLSRRRLVNVLRLLLHEQISIGEVEVILERFAMGSLETPEDWRVAELVRSGLSAATAAPEIGALAVLDPTLELMLKGSQGVRFGQETIALPVAAVSSLVEHLREAMNARDAAHVPSAIVVRDAAMRPLVYRIIEQEFAVPVVAMRDLLPQHVRRITRVIGRPSGGGT